MFFRLSLQKCVLVEMSLLASPGCGCELKQLICSEANVHLSESRR